LVHGEPYLDGFFLLVNWDTTGRHKGEDGFSKILVGLTRTKKSIINII
jgi:hypothetical protein